MPGKINFNHDVLIKGNIKNITLYPAEDNAVACWAGGGGFEFSAE
jgi:hypothetical protein